jgi:tetratricopeptide (TPR) repeat protein
MVALLLLCGGLGVLAYHHFRSNSPEYLLKRGLELAQAGDFDRAVQIADRLGAIEERDRQALLLGEILFHQHEFDQAVAAMKHIRTEAFRVRAADRIGRCLLALGHRREAESAFHYLLKNHPDHTDSHRFLAVIYYDQGDYARALSHLAEVIRLDPADARPHRLAGLIHKDQDQVELAEEAYRQALAHGLDPGAASELRAELADCQLRRQKPAEALETLANVESAAAAVFRIEALNALGRKADAANALDDALVRYPMASGLRRLHGERLLADGRAEDAVKQLTLASAADPSDRRVVYHLVRAYEHLGRRDDAREQERRLKDLEKLLKEVSDLSRAATQDPWDPTVRRRLADIFDQFGKADLAVMWRRAAEACSPPAKQ